MGLGRGIMVIEMVTVVPEGVPVEVGEMAEVVGVREVAGVVEVGEVEGVV